MLTRTRTPPRRAPVSGERRPEPGFSRRQKVALAAVLLVIGVAHLITIRPGQGWHDDFASYIAHARNLSEGVPYGDTGYVWHEEILNAGPRAYPPLYPLVLAPVYEVFGADLLVMKVELVGFLLAWLALVAVLLRRRTSAHVAIGVVVFLGLNPFIIDFKNNILSDIPFAMMLTLALLAADQLFARAHRPLARDAALLGFSVWLAALARPSGALVLAAAWVAALLFHRSRLRALGIASAVFGSLTLLQLRILDTSGDYLSVLQGASPRLAAVQAWRYVRSLEGLTQNGFASEPALVLSAAITILAVIGSVRALRRRSPIDLFVVLYVALIFVWPSFQSLRFLVPILPFYALYAIDGATALTRLRRATVMRFATVSIAIALAGSYALVLPRIAQAGAIEGSTSADAVATFEYLAVGTPADSVIAFRRPKALALYAERRSISYPTADAARLGLFFRQNGVGYLVDGPVDDGTLDVFVEERPDDVEAVFERGEYVVWRLRTVND